MSDEEQQADARRHEEPRDFELTKIALEFANTGRSDYAVLAIQTAAELYIEHRLAGIIAWRNLGPLGDLILKRLVPPPYNFRDDRLKALWTSLTRDEIQQHEWWDRYIRHVKLRHAVVHSGKHVSRDEAEESMLAASMIMAHVQTVFIKTGVRLGKLVELGTAPPENPDPY